MRSYYFDHNATTPIAEEALEVFDRALRDGFGNASSIHHLGQAARQALESARLQVCGLIGCGPKELILGSGGTEANNQALLAAMRRRERPHVIVSAIEHPAVLNMASELERRGAHLSLVRVSGSGVVDPDDVRRALRPDTVLVSVMHVNNETGAIQPVAEIGRIAREAEAWMHSDGVQAAGRIPVDIQELEADLYSISAHKFRGPKGCGALYVRKGLDVPPLLFGGRHESGRRAGTENVPAAAAMGKAAELARREVMTQAEQIRALRNSLEDGILAAVPDVIVNGGAAPRVPNTSNLCFEGIEGESMVIALDLKGFCVSSGSACSSGAVEPSHVLLAMGLNKQMAKSSVRFSLGPGTKGEEVDALIEAVSDAAAHLRRLSPTYAAHV